MLNILKVLRDAGTINEETMETIEKEHESVLKPLRVKADKVGETEKFITENETLKSQIEELKLQKSTPNGEHEAKFKGLEKQLLELTTSLAKEREAKIDAIKKSELSKVVGGIDGLDPRHKKMVEFELSQALKIGEDGVGYFERDGVSVDTKGFMGEYLKENTSILLPKGAEGNGTAGGYVAGNTSINRAALSTMSKEEYNKIAPEIFSGKITIGE
jgi:hypothetical protein